MQLRPRPQRNRLAAALAAAAAVLLTPSPAATRLAPPAEYAQEDARLSQAKASPLDDLLRPRPGEDLSLKAVTTRLLDAGPSETARFLRTFEAHALRLQKEGEPVTHLSRLGAVMRESPALIASVIGDSRVPAEARVDAAGVALEILRRDPTDRTLEILIALVENAGVLSDGGAARLQPGVLDVVEQLTTAEAGSDERVRRLYVAAAPRLSVTIIDGIARGDSADFALRRLAWLLGELPSVDGAVLNRIHIVSERQPTYADRWTHDRISGYLDDERAFARHEAAASLGSIGDRNSVSELIWLLGDPAPSVREAAHRSLKSLTSMTIAGDPVRWRLWFDQQEEWWQMRGEALVARIPSAGRAELVEILRETCTKRLYHREIAPALLALIAREDVESVEIGLSALGTLRAPSALPAVRALQQHSDALVRQRATAALRSYRQAHISPPLSGPLSLTPSQR